MSRTRYILLLLPFLALPACNPDDRSTSGETLAESGADPISATPAREAVPIPPGLGGESATGRVLETETGEATFYADILERRRTASGEALNQEDMVAAHRRFPFGTVLRVTNTRNNRSVRVRVIDRGPFGAPAKAQRTVIDLSRRAARELGFLQQGRTTVKVEVLATGEGLPRAR